MNFEEWWNLLHRDTGESYPFVRRIAEAAYAKGRVEGLREALAEASVEDAYSSCDCAAAIERLLSS
jgi:hypothetical protein